MFLPVFPIEFRPIVDCFDHRHFHIVQGVSGKVEVLSRGFFKMVIPDVSQVLGESRLKGFLCLSNVLETTLGAGDDVDQVLTLTGVALGQLHLTV